MVSLFQKHRSFFTVIGGLIILVVIITLARYFQSRTGSLNQNISTPELIDQAYTWGFITEDERLLYLAYALYEPESLPVQYRSNVEWFGEATVEELQKALNPPEVVCSMSPHVRNEFLRMSHSDTLCD